MSKASKSDLDASSFAGTDSLSIDAGEQGPKYDKLVQDYVKLRSKLTVLKKAYVEQSELTAKKDQTIRKFELEIEALSFRNQQLTARVESLQRELDDRAQKPVAPSSSSSNSSLGSIKPSAELLAEELQHKIEENQTLHRKLNEIEVDLRQKIIKTQETLSQVEYEKMLLDKKLDALELSSKTSIEKLENDKIKLELNVIQLEDQLRSTHLEKEQLIKKESDQHDKPSVNQQQQASNHLPNQLKSSFDFLIQIYTSVEELVAKEPKICKHVSKCIALSNQVASSFTNSKLSQIDALLGQLVAANHHMLSAIMEHLIRTNHNQQMDKLNKKLKIYINKLDQFLYMDENNFGSILKQVSQCLTTSQVAVTSEALALQIQTLIDILEKLLFALTEKLSLKYTLDYSVDSTTLDECLVSHITQFKQSLAGLNSSPGLVESIVQLKSELYPDTQVNMVEREEIQELGKIVEEKELCINELEEKCRHLGAKCEQYEAEIGDLRSKLSTVNVEQSKCQEAVSSLDEMDTGLERPTVQVFEAQIDTLNKRIQYLDSKVVYYYDEMASLIERLKIQAGLNETQFQEIGEIKDQLERTRSSYEMQISTMSDHLIEVTERMSKQSEENEKLKHELEMVYVSKSAKAKRTK